MGSAKSVSSIHLLDVLSQSQHFVNNKPCAFCMYVQTPWTVCMGLYAEHTHTYMHMIYCMCMIHIGAVGCCYCWWSVVSVHTSLGQWVPLASPRTLVNCIIGYNITFFSLLECFTCLNGRSHAIFKSLYQYCE